MKKTALLTAMVFASLLMQFCTDDGCGDSDFQFKDRFLNAYVYNQMMRLSNQAFEYAGKDSAEIRNGDTLCFLFHCDVRTAQIEMCKSNADLMACTPEPIPLAKALGDSLKVIALDEFNDLYPAGSDVSDMFRLFNPNFSTNLFYPLTQFNSNRFKNEDQMLFLAMTGIPSKGLKRFRLSVYGADSMQARVFDTPEIKLY